MQLITKSIIMKITKDFLRGLIKESIEEVKQEQFSSLHKEAYLARQAIERLKRTCWADFNGHERRAVEEMLNSIDLFIADTPDRELIP